MISLGSAALVGVKFLMLQTTSKGLDGTSDKLLARVIDHLVHASNTSGDAVQRCELMVRGMVNIWERRPREDSGSFYPSPSPDQYYPAPNPHTAAEYSQALPQGDGVPTFDFDTWFNSTLGNLDTDFWASLIPNMPPGEQSGSGDLQW